MFKVVNCSDKRDIVQSRSDMILTSNRVFDGRDRVVDVVVVVVVDAACSEKRVII